MNNKDDNDSFEKYPEEGLPIGTFVRPNRLNRLGIIVDAFYGDLDQDNQKIIIYTILTMPNNTIVPLANDKNSQCYLSNEYEYDVTAYLMIRPCSAAFVSEIMRGIYYET